MGICLQAAEQPGHQAEAAEQDKASPTDTSCSALSYSILQEPLLFGDEASQIAVTDQEESQAGCQARFSETAEVHTRPALWPGQ